MKKFFLLITIISAVTASAQMKTMFYGSSWTALKDLQDSIKKVVPGYFVSRVDEDNDSKSVAVYFNNNTEKSFFIRVYKNIINNKPAIGEVQIHGDYDAL